MAKRNSDKTTKIALPVREFLRQLLKSKIKNLEDRRKLAEYLGHAPTSVANLLKGEGSLDTWIAVICFYYDVDSKKLMDLIRNFDALMRKHNPKESDRIAAQIRLPEAKRAVLFSGILTSLRVNDDD